MSQLDPYKEVYFCAYCHKCTHESKKESDSPCDECLANPVNENSHKPIKFEEKG